MSAQQRRGKRLHSIWGKAVPACAALKRAWLDRVGWEGQCRVRGNRRGLEASLQDRPALFEPRLCQVDGLAPEPRAILLGRTVDLKAPMDWSAREWGKQHVAGKRALHSMEFLEGVRPALFQELVDDWLADNARPARGAWRDAWDPTTLAVRCCVWMRQLALDAQSLAPDFVERARASLSAQVAFLERNLDLADSASSIKQLKAMLWAGNYFCGDQARRWKRRAERELSQALDEQVLDDGMHCTQSPALHVQVMVDLLECRDLVGDVVLMARLESLLTRMGQALVELTHPDGQVSQFHDSGEFPGYDPAECLDVLERLTGARPSPSASFALQSAGYFGVRNAQTYFVASCRSQTPAAWPGGGDADCLSFEWSLRGRRMVVDAGVYEHKLGEWSEWSRSTLAHNTLIVGGKDQVRFSKRGDSASSATTHVSRWEKVGTSHVIEAWHDGYQRLRGKPVHHRRMLVGDHGLQIEDHVAGGAGQTTQARLLLHPDVNIVKREKLLFLTSGDAVAALETDHETSIEEAWWFPRLGVRRRTRQIVVHYGPAPSSGGFLLQASRPEFEWTAFLRRLHQAEQPAA